MNNTRILDVLTDLKTFASLNGLTQLAGELDSTHRVATAELDALMERPVVGSETVHRGRGPQLGSIGKRFRA